MATSFLNTTALDFLNAGATQSKLTGAANLLTVEGVGGANCVVRGVETPTQGTDAANKDYVDSLAAGLHWRASVKVATVTNGNLATDFANGGSVDGIGILTNDRILIKNQTNGIENGIYIVQNLGVPLRAPDLALGASAAAVAIFTQQGNTQADTAWVCTNDTGSDLVGTNPLTFTQFNGASNIIAGLGLSKTGNTLDVNVDDSSIEISTDTLQVKALGVTDAMLAGSISNAKLTNDAVTVTAGDGLQTGGSVALGASVTLDVDSTVVRTTGAQSIAGSKTFSDDTTVTAQFSVNHPLATISTAGPETYTAAQMFCGVIERDCNGATRIDSVATAANIVAEIPNAVVGSAFNLVIVNTSGAAETINLNPGTGVNFESGGTFTVEQGKSREFLVRCTNVTPASETVTIYDLGENGTSGGGGGTPGGADTQIQYNNAGAFGGVSTITTDGTNMTFNGGDLNISDNDMINVGTGDDLVITHDGTDSTITSSTGNLIVDNTNATGFTRFVLGSDDNSTGFVVVDNSNQNRLAVTGDGTVGISEHGFWGLDSYNAPAGTPRLGVAVGATATTDTTTAASGTAANFYTMSIGTETLAAQNASVTTTDAASLHVVGTPIAGTNQTITNNWAVKVDAGDSSFGGQVYSTGFLTTSDATLKTNFNPLSDPLAKLKQIEGLSYNWKDEEKLGSQLEWGVLAQDLEKAGMENLVSERGDHKTVNYLGLIPLLIEGIKELSAKVEKYEKTN